ncbi:MAG: prolipoprotein diacylglyceryl transferase [Albidovulum sp.]|uniref:prolipoprotein diacylglyceryl transferase n=1 Tax=Albidovulum sp. TaxID=1872424 RepID=UPI001326CFDF|nr:prolipoprotein diacylglyceryl transferase [Defluviimonas sp.]KAB2880784.1 MAG: prolipoprotein diacylglyceryl transferase [Defluviimonas sp.]
MQAAIPFPDISSEVFSVELFGAHLALRWYALAYLAGLVGGFLVIRRLMRRAALWPGNLAPMAPERADDLLTAIILGVILGGRLGFVLFYQPLYYLAHPLDIVKVWEGGMSFHGGFLGVLVAGLWFTRRNGVPAMQLSDAMAFVAPIGLFFGRIANFVNAELWGRPTDLPWGVIFPGTDAQDCPGVLPGLCARHPSQLYEAGLEGLALGLLLWFLVRTGALKRPGLVTGVFLLGYGAARFAVEFARQADAQFISPGNPLGHALQLGGFGLSMGQILSLPMVLAGLWFITRARPA